MNDLSQVPSSGPGPVELLLQKESGGDEVDAQFSAQQRELLRRVEAEMRDEAEQLHAVFRIILEEGDFSFHELSRRRSAKVTGPYGFFRTIAERLGIKHNGHPQKLAAQALSWFVARGREHIRDEKRR